MTHSRRALSFAITCLITMTGQANADQAIDGIPIAPASVMTDNVPPPIKSDAASATHNTIDTSANRFEVEPGETQVLAVSAGYMNRLVTPFPKAVVMTSSLTPGDGGQCGEICVKDNIVFVTPGSSKPVALNVYQDGNEAASMMLTLMPKKIPPREISLTLNGYTGARGLGGDTEAAQQWEEVRPYTATIREIFSEMALGQVPQGYSLHSLDQGPIPVCQQDGMRFDFIDGQLLKGSHFSVAVGVMHNETKGPLEFRETACGGWNVAAVAAWPRVMLGPGQATEIYVALSEDRISSNRRAASDRPSLVE